MHYLITYIHFFLLIMLNQPTVDCIIMLILRKRNIHCFVLVLYTIGDISIIHHHQPINVPTAGAQAFLMDYPQGEIIIIITIDNYIHINTPIEYPLDYKHTYHSRFIPEGVAEVSQIFLRDRHVLPK
jgi:hypothetical protein